MCKAQGVSFYQTTYAFRRIDCNIDKALFTWLLMTTVNSEFEQSDLKKQIDDPHNIIYQNAIHYKEGQKAFMQKN